MSERKSTLMAGWALLATSVVMTAVMVLLGYVVLSGAAAMGSTLFVGDAPLWPALSGQTPVWGGIWPACVGSLTVVVLSLLLALVPGIGTGVWMATVVDSRLSRCLGVAVDVLAGVPSILMGLFGFTLILFLRQWYFPAANTSLLLAAACLAMLIIPYLAVSTRTALQSLPPQLRQTALSLGMSESQTCRHVLLPQARGGIMAGILLAIGRAAEDTAVIMLTGAVVNAGLPGGLLQRFEALPFSIFYLSAQYQSQQELTMAFGAALTLMLLTATLFAVAGGLQRAACRRRWGDLNQEVIHDRRD
ncbi:phosphate ABC transporter membrane protein 2, PhoT family [Ferrimonas sediminum]|uniref:Phosphate ABC transporter membrane protein 2, PhoT family n=1 Tax=Ferrimonas sediminum TaxID=718193 RepID=A0A1G9AZA9_9GAMM|nr:ABC transporter permease subunit [Ferrimonas sediminum]SDK32573.1 phosphate ABC transporter membrane protein 2, PhoT family [Ferrimonas sediminum]